ncbi:hypothetical protein [Sphingobium algorifonticola]|uniref:ATPase n=1 Tax=Sphingobium algorifonticola TaxID=2008318 RepID=A0A437J787_9SPHN|nr:hypothetical protein [Sphingobium algorifonticola]RVT40907.1 hypothetical protein ENE74_10615 [Sphingobium algorifonticola]
MNGGQKIVDLWRDTDRAAAQATGNEQELLLEDSLTDPDDPGQAAWDEVDPAPPSRRFTIVGFLFGLVAATWLIFSLWVLLGRGRPLPALEALPMTVATIAMPLALLATAYLLLMRSSRSEALRFADTARLLRAESAALEARVQRLGQQLATARDAMVEQASLLESYGASASANMEASAKIIAAHAASAAASASTAERAGQQLADQLRSMTQDMPLLEDRAAEMTARLIDSGHALSERIDGLESRLHAIAELSDDARSRTLAATKSLTSQLSQLQDATRATSDEVNGMAELAANRIDVALDRARTALTETSTGLDAQSSMLATLVDRARATLGDIGQDTMRDFAEHSAEIESRLHDLDRLIEGQTMLASGLSSGLGEQLAMLEARFASFEADGLARNERLARALAKLATEAERMDQALVAGNSTAEQLIGKSETLMLAIDSSVREVDETYPLALQRLNGRIGETRGLLAAAAPEIEALEAVADAILGRTQEAEELLRGQSRRLTEWLESTEGGLKANRMQVDGLQDALDTAGNSATRLTESAGPQLIAALLRVKDTADQAADRARQALARAIPEAAQALGDASEQAMQKAIGDRVTAQIAEVAQVAEQAVKAAHQASDRLMRQLLTIADTSASIEQRINDAEQAAESRDRDNFARRSALLIESLNSTAIDVAKILSNDVSDSAWAAYLKGDRGVFTRRAVKLLDAGQSREIALHYDNDGEFREHVNRYIHDFEGMLRTILSARDGSALAVTMLSSDMGKLYVALAQAIERLRQ